MKASDDKARETADRESVRREVEALRAGNPDRDHLADLQERHNVLLEEVAHLRAGRPELTLGECSDYLLKLCEENGGADFGTWFLQSGDQRWELTVRRCEGRTPADKLNALESTIEQYALSVRAFLVGLEEFEWDAETLQQRFDDLEDNTGDLLSGAETLREENARVDAFQMTVERRWSNAEWPSWLHEAWQEERGKAVWCDPEGDGDESQETLYVATDSGVAVVHPPLGQWIVLRRDGSLDVLLDSELRERYGHLLPRGGRQP